ncbi:MAG: (Fe-S)-binding protein [Deltaproteobacteria bacterium]|nr:(Fe-S)-binding protein [Deltaproteobacteria bacterium]
MFNANKCDFCGECLARCYYLPFDSVSGGIAIKELLKLREGAREEPPQWIYDCITCVACNEYCEQGAKPFDLILSWMEKDFTSWELREQMAARFLPEGPPKPIERRERMMSLCVMQGSMPWALQGQLFENIPLLKGKHYFCNVLFVHMGDESIMRERLQAMVDNLAASGAKEIVFVHDDCYAAVKGMAPEYGINIPFRPVHLFEYLHEYLIANSKKVKKLGILVAYQRPCASRYTTEKDYLVDEIFQLIGVERVKRKYDGLKALCCGVEIAGPGLKLFPRGKNYEPYRDLNIADAKASGAEAMVYLCPMCFNTLKEKSQLAGLKNYMISDICRLALGENPQA